MRALALVLVVALGCRSEAAQERLPSARPASSTAPVIPGLNGRYRLDATLAFDQLALGRLGAPRAYTVDLMRQVKPDGFLVKARTSWAFDGLRVTVRSESLFREANGRYSWSYCEGVGAVDWKAADRFEMPREVVVRGQSGTADEHSEQLGSCAAVLPSGSYRLDHGQGELRALRNGSDGSWGYLLVLDDGLLDVAAEARRLSGLARHP
jgi:hypothetical protein